MKREDVQVSRAIFMSLVAVMTIYSYSYAQNGGQQPIQPRERDNPSNVLASGGEDYRIGAGDVIEIKIDKAPELSGPFRVNSDGTIPMHYLGRIVASKKTPEELGQLIADSLRGRYLRDPKVSVVVTQYNSRSLFIQGSVRVPGVYQIEGKPTLLKLLILAGGLDKDHGSWAFIIREIKKEQQSQKVDIKPVSDSTAENGQPSDTVAEDGAKYDIFKVNISNLFKGDISPKNNPAIEPGDFVHIPSTDVFFVAGEVKRPGSFPLKDGTTLRQALSLAEGTTFEAAKSRGVIFRDNLATGERQEIAVNVDDVMRGKKADIPIKANDIIVIPNSRWKSFSKTLLYGFGGGGIRIPGIY